MQRHIVEKATPISPHTLYLVELWLAYSLPLIFIQENMAREPWNRVNIPFPSAVSSVCIPFNSTTGRVYCTKNIISVFMSLSAHKSRHLKPTWGAWMHVHYCGSLKIVVELSLLLSYRCKSQSRVGWKGQCAQANPERDSPDGDPSYVQAAVRPKQQLQRQQDLPRRKAGELPSTAPNL